MFWLISTLTPHVWQYPIWVSFEFLDFLLSVSSLGLGFIVKIQRGTKFLGQLTYYALISPPLPLAPKQCCSLCSPVHFNLSWKCFVIPTLFGLGRGGPLSVSTWLEKCILCYIWLFDKLRMWKQGFPWLFQGFLSSIVYQALESVLYHWF